MRDRARYLIAFCALLLGVAHLAVGFAAYEAFTLDALWFAGTGLAIMSVAVSNFSLPASGLRYKITYAAQNLIMVIFFAAAWIVLPAPQVAVGAVLFSALLLFRLSDFRHEQSSGE